MRAYEAMVVLAPTLDDAAVESAIGRVRKVIEEQGGAVEKVDLWGRRRLAYEIGDHKEGIYAVIDFRAPAPAGLELERVLRISDDVLRHLIVRQEETKATRAAALRAQAQAQAAAQARGPAHAEASPQPAE